MATVDLHKYTYSIRFSAEREQWELLMTLNGATVVRTIEDMWALVASTHYLHVEETE